MSAKCMDAQGRWRSKTIGVRVSPEEDAILNVAVSLSGLTKQDYIMKKLTDKEVKAQPNPRVFKALKKELEKVWEELVRLSSAGEVSKDLLEEIHLITVVLGDVKGGTEWQSTEAKKTTVHEHRCRCIPRPRVKSEGKRNAGNDIVLSG